MPQYRDSRMFTVEGNGSFPLDMLRYDCCWPHDSEAVERISADWKNHRVKVRLASHRPPTSERWASFGWRVVPERSVT